MAKSNKAKGPKAKLTPLEKIKAAYLYCIAGATQAQIAAAFDNVNNGRVNEAIKQITKAVGISDGGYLAHKEARGEGFEQWRTNGANNYGTQTPRE